MTTTVWDGWNKYFDDPAYTRPSKRPTTSLVEILERVHDDKRFDATVTVPGPANVDALLGGGGHEETLLEYWNSWTLTDPLAQFRDSQFAATLLFVGTTKPDKTRDYDFFLVHVLTTSHAVRVLLPLIPAAFHLQLVRQWWFFALVTYVTQMRPAFGVRNIKDYDLAGRDWEWVDNMALKSTHGVDAHYVKGVYHPYLYPYPYPDPYLPPAQPSFSTVVPRHLSTPCFLTPVIFKIHKSRNRERERESQGERSREHN